MAAGVCLRKQQGGGRCSSVFSLSANRHICLLVFDFAFMRSSPSLVLHIAAQECKEQDDVKPLSTSTSRLLTPRTCVVRCERHIDQLSSDYDSEIKYLNKRQVVQ
ncbi:hypothetical protein F2P81_023003 [Scophthalmus maximus]|uniref:Uncharacterized protein n=1 Tax=Scophthalmus maximus TaxID=52904 RepID=A0A6A4RYZ4_SCOMX|nr:hypothetical protein F2P81_023003 [Scophthalmus maximus]